MIVETKRNKSIFAKKNKNMAAPKKPTESDRSAIIKGIDSPLGFFVLALFIVETFLTLVLTYANLDSNLKPIFTWVGCGLFILVTIIVTLLVWFKPENLTFDRAAHLNKAQFGSEQQTIKPEQRFGNQSTQS